MSNLIFVLTVLAVLVSAILLLRARRITVLYPPNVGLLYRNGRFERELEPGRHVFFDPLKRVHIVHVSRAALPVVLPEFTVLSKDQFSFRIALSPILAVVDARAFIESQPAVEPSPYSQFLPHLASHAALHPLTASAAMEVISGQSLREIFADPQIVTSGVQAKMGSSIPGATIERVLLTSITLPPETRRMFTDVERSKLEAEASLERARGEQASLRVLANAARLISDNPALANLRFLQTLEQASGPKTIVVGGGSVPLSGDLSGAAGAK